MHKMETKKKSPEVRFAGFTEEWDADLFENLTTINQGLQIPISNRFKKKILDSHFYITNEFLKEGAKSEYYILNPPESVLCTKEDVLMTRTGNTGEVVTGVEGAFHNNFFKIKFDRDKIDKDYLIYFLKNEATQSLILRLAGVSTIPDLNHNNFYQIEMPFPEIAEQKNISQLLGSLDKLIVNHQTQLTKLKNLKKAMLTKMFPQNGASVPEIRFKGFDGEWDFVSFGTIAKCKRGLTYSPDDLRKHGIKVLRSSNIYDGFFIEKEDDVFVCEEAINIDFIKEGDIIITAANGSSHLVGKHAIVENLKTRAVHGGFMLIAETKVPYLLNASMSSTWYKKFLIQNIAGGNGAIGNLKGNNLEEYLIHVPKEEQEQIKIGEYFKNLDALMSNHQKQLKKLDNIKKACLNKLFVS